MNVFVIIACHFAEKGQICSTTLERLKRAFALAGPEDQFIVTGDLSYEAGGPRLGELMRDWLVQAGIDPGRVHMLKEGVGTFSEARRGVSLFRDLFPTENGFRVVSSWWYFLQGKGVWERRGREKGLLVRFESVRGGGAKTLLVYAVLGAILFPSHLRFYENWMEGILDSRQAKRREGFHFDGCG